MKLDEIEIILIMSVNEYIWRVQVNALIYKRKLKNKFEVWINLKLENVEKKKKFQSMQWQEKYNCKKMTKIGLGCLER